MVCVTFVALSLVYSNPINGERASVVSSSFITEELRSNSVLESNQSFSSYNIHDFHHIWKTGENEELEISLRGICNIPDESWWFSL
jgi:hypothetical protein